MRQLPRLKKLRLRQNNKQKGESRPTTTTGRLDKRRNKGLIKRELPELPFFCPNLQWDHVLCLWAFLTIRDVELNFLTIGQSLESIALDRAEMNEHIGAIFTFDKAESFGFVKPFNRTSCLRHNVYLYS
ncbi:Uncharacterised protein [Halioglobus japonicus]|nr:Uncharacterised protein [Halioglobus japonicus]